MKIKHIIKFPNIFQIYKSRFLLFECLMKDKIEKKHTLFWIIIFSQSYEDIGVINNMDSSCLL